MRTMKLTSIVIFLATSSVTSFQEIYERIEAKGNTLTIIPTPYIKETFLSGKNFQVVYDEDISQLTPSVLAIPYIICIAPVLWVSGGNFSVDEIDSDTYHSLEKIKATFQLFYPNIGWTGRLVSKKLIPNVSPNLKDHSHVGLLFSGGLDCVSTSLGHYGKQQLLITNHGVDIPYDNLSMWESVQKQCRLFAQSYGHKNTFISLNFCSILNYNALKKFAATLTKWWWLDSVVDALNHCGVTSPILYLKGYPQLLIAASHTEEFPYPYGSHPLIDNKISFAGIAVHHDQEEYNRCQKIEIVQSASQHFKKKIPALRVCWSTKDGTNCHSCEKCLRTLNNILVTGNNPSDFGFEISTAHIVQKTKDFLKKDPIKDSKTFWEWSVIQRRSLSFQSGNDLLNKHFAWLARTPIGIKHKDKICANDFQYPYFSLLWYRKK